MGVDDSAMDTSQLLKGVLDLAVLSVLAHDDAYGYHIVRTLRESGLEEVGDASVYGTLRRLYRGGKLTSYVKPSDEGPHRKYYGLNEAGRDHLDEGTKIWHSFTETLDLLLEGAAR
jgi:PadR family transcriptional regulator PadR